MKRTLIAPAALALALAAGPASGEAAPQERAVGLDTQTGVAVTIYNGDLALIKDQRSIRLERGRNLIGFVDVSGRMRPETALLRGDGAAELTLIEQNFNFDLLTPEKLLEKSVGQTIRVARVNPATGEETIVDAKVLSAAGGVVLQIGDRIETGIPGRLIFSGVPETLRARPTLVIELDSSQAGTVPVELSYLSGGLTWKADYVAELNDTEDRLDLNGWVTLTNTSGTTYNEARMQLVAGEVNRVREHMTRTMAMPAEAKGAAQRDFREETFFDYHLYTLDRPTTIADNQTKQVALLNADGIAVAKEYRLGGTGSFVYQQRIAPVTKPKVEVVLEFVNDEKGGIGLPLPQGVMRVYKRDSGGKALFVGEDGIGHTPKGEKVRLKVGSAFDVTSERKQTEFTRLAQDSWESAHEITLKNARKEPVTVIVTETIPGDWQMLRESAPHTKVTSGQAEWRIAVPAEGSATLTYKVRVKH